MFADWAVSKGMVKFCSSPKLKFALFSTVIARLMLSSIIGGNIEGQDKNAFIKKENSAPVSRTAVLTRHKKRKKELSILRRWKKKKKGGRCSQVIDNEDIS